MKNDGSTFQERLARAADAKQKALEKLRSKPPVEHATLAERQAAHLRREAVAAEKRAAKAAEREQAKAAKSASAEKTLAVPLVRTEIELKAARDARYAARKKRK